MPKTINKIPEDWEVEELGNIIKYVKGKKPTSAKEIYENGYVPYLSTEYLRSNIETSFAKVDENVISVKNGELILLWDGSNAGEFFIGKDGILSSTMVKFFLKKEMDAKFLFYSLKQKEQYVSGQTKGTGIPHVDKNVLEKIRILIPSLPEQRAIARILSTVDEAIQKADEAIERTERLKRGVMRRLLTEGIGHKEFKETEIGRIPDGWEVVRLKEITLPTENIDPRSETEKDFKYVDIASIENLAIIGWNLINSKNAPSRARQLIKTKDVIFATTRPYLKNMAMVPKNLDGQICSTGFCVVRANEEFTISEWIFYNISTDRFIYRITSKMKGATYPAVSDKDVLDEKLLLPPLNEQQKITEILSSVDKKIELERKRKGRLERIKKGLMNDLLTGRKRVKM
jgi:type I restriction enzyme S subunit